jgi:hypothetical protein
MKEYRQTPEYKACQKEYENKRKQSPERKAYQKEYKQTPEYKANRREYENKRSQTPERKAYQKELYQNNKKKKAETQGEGTLDPFLK